MRIRRGAWVAAVCATLLLAVVPVNVQARPRAFFITPTWGTLSSPLGWRVDPFEPSVRQHHWGIDIAAKVGTPVLASAAGVVKYAGWYAGYGGTVYIDHGNGWSTVYGHLGAISVPAGQRVRQGTVIGAVGSNGRSTGPHLHFEIRYQDRPVDPLRYLGR